MRPVATSPPLAPVDMAAAAPRFSPGSLAAVSASSAAARRRVSVVARASSLPGRSRRRVALVAAGVSLLALNPGARSANALDSYSGVGLEIFLAPDGTPTVVECFGPGYAKRAGPAYEAGVRVGDAIVAVDANATRGRALGDVAAALRGDGRPGSEVRMTVRRRAPRRASAGANDAEETIVVATRAVIDPSARSCFAASCARA